MDAAARILCAPGRFRKSPTDPHLTGFPGRPAGLQNQETEFKARFQPADEIPSAEKIVIDTGAPLLENIIRILSDASGPAPAA